MKQRVSSLDLKILIPELESKIKGHRLQNIYNLVVNNRSFLLKFSLPDSKFNVVLESGFKVYLTDFQRPTLPEPSNFSTKLRKHLKAKRLTNVKQVGDDRIVVMEFSDGLYYLVFEFFSAGNIILLDADLKIMSLYRFVEAIGQVQEGQYDIGAVYNMFDKTLFNESDIDPHNEVYDKDLILKWISDTKQTEREKKKILSVEKLCFQHSAYLSSDLIHIQMLNNDIKPSTSCLQLLEDEQLMESTVKAMNECQQRYKELLSKPIGEVDGYILSKKNPLFKEEVEASPDNLEYVYQEFHPYEPIHKIKDGVKIECIKGYNKTVDEFFTNIEMTKVSLGRQTQQANIEKRLQFVKDEHQKKLQALDEVQELNFRKGYLINFYNEQIEQCKESVQKLLDQKMDWKNIEKLIKIEQTRGNEIAKMIKSLNLIKNEITVSLVDIDENNDDSVSNSNEDDESDWGSSDSDSDSDDDDDDNETEDENKNSVKSDNKKKQNVTKTVDVIIDITQSAFANSSRYFDAKRSAKDKQEKTAKNAAIAIKSSEQKIQNDLKKIEKETKQNVEFKQLRLKYWFEKFFWFISSEGYLCIAGRDDNQVDTIYYRYFDNETDFLVSNDLDGALKVFIKNPYKNQDVPPTTFMQAGIFSLSTTKAWENKMVTSPWYVVGKDISKKDYDGTILPDGLINVSKERNYLPPCQMVMGAGLLFTSDLETFAKYKEAKINRDEELQLVCNDKTVGNSNKIQELNTMLKKLKELEEKYNAEENSEAKANEVDNASDSEDENDKQEAYVPVAPTPSQQTQTKIRGKKGKMKKIKEKYGEQDDEDRKLRMAVIGTLKQVEKTEQKEQPKNGTFVMTSAMKKHKKRQLQINQITKLITLLENRNEDNDATDDIDYVEYSKIVNDYENYHINITGLLPSPNKTDNVTDCIPVFAPWGALNKYAYKVKLQPGTLKKGKTVSDTIELFKRHTLELQKEESDWYDTKNIIELMSQQDFMMNLTASRFKVGSGAGSNDKSKSSKGGHGKVKGGSKSKGKKK